MEFAYRKLLEEHKLNVSDLNADAQNGIDTLVAMERAVNMALKKNKNVTDKTYSKIKTNDKWVCMEILEHVDGKQRNPEAQTVAPVDVEEVEKQIETDNANTEVAKHAPIDVELNGIFSSGTTKLTLEELKTKAPKSYNVIFDNYEVDSKNGLITTNFELLEIETEKETFILTKK